ncbi:transposase [Lichenicoccus roseus]|uniref:Transposase n=1 Tax=Lichenicoccus roseus TaxID=2683649 RepID=A0A5R9IZK7_9PROT|nr:transposase [Lichenicoccus roseus]
MRGSDGQSGALFSYVGCEARVPAGHPLRLIRAVVNEALDALCGDSDRLYARIGRPGIAPEKLQRALLVQAFYSIRSNRQLMKQLDYNLLFRWLVDLSMDAPVWNATTFSKNRERLLYGDVAQRLLTAVVAQPQMAPLMSNEHFSVNGILIQAWASHKSFQPKPDDDHGDTPLVSPLRRQGVMPSRTGAGRSGATRRIATRPIQMPGSAASQTGNPASWPMPGIFSWRTAAAW